MIYQVNPRLHKEQAVATGWSQLLPTVPQECVAELKQKNTVMFYVKELHKPWPWQHNVPRLLIQNAVIDPNQWEQTETAKNRYLLLPNSSVVLPFLLYPRKENDFPVWLLLPQSL